VSAVYLADISFDKFVFVVSILPLINSSLYVLSATSAFMSFYSNTSSLALLLSSFAILVVNVTSSAARFVSSAAIRVVSVVSAAILAVY
jgi:hypothetical protein